MSKKMLTLNIGASSIQLAEYEVGAKGALTLVNYGMAPLAAPLDVGNADTVLSPALLEIVREKGIKPGKVALTVSGQMVFPRFAAIPQAGGDDRFEQLVRYEIEQNIPFPIDEMVCDRQIIGDTESGDKSVMIVAAKIDQVEAITNALAAVGFIPEIVDVAPIALTNVLKHADPDSERCSVILDIGSKTTSLVIAEGDKLYNRSIPVAGNTITKEIAAALGCTQEEAEQFKREHGYVSMGGVTEDDDATVDRVAKVCRATLTRLNAEVLRSINFYRSQQGGGKPEVLYLTGGTALLPQADKFFAESLQLEVTYFNPFEAIGVGAKIDATVLEVDGALLASTAGAALHAADQARYTINLLPPSLVEDRAERAKIPFVIAAGVALIVGLVLVMLSFNRDAAVINSQAEAVQAQVDTLVRYNKKVEDAKAKQVEAEARAESMRQLLANRAAAIQRINAVRNSLPKGMWIEKWEAGRITLRYWVDRIKASGGKTVGEMVVDKLKHQTVIEAESVKIADMSAIGKDEQVQQFTVELKFK